VGHDSAGCREKHNTGLRELDLGTARRWWATDPGNGDPEKPRENDWEQRKVGVYLEQRISEAVKGVYILEGEEVEEYIHQAPVETNKEFKETKERFHGACVFI
jgi:hypothetical protein